MKQLAIAIVVLFSSSAYAQDVTLKFTPEQIQWLGQAINELPKKIADAQGPPTDPMTEHERLRKLYLDSQPTATATLYICPASVGMDGCNATTATQSLVKMYAPHQCRSFHEIWKMSLKVDPSGGSSLAVKMFIPQGIATNQVAKVICTPPP